MNKKSKKLGKSHDRVKNSTKGDSAETGRINHGPDAVRRIRPAITAKARYHVDNLVLYPAGGGAYTIFQVLSGVEVMCDCGTRWKANRISRALNATI